MTQGPTSRVMRLLAGCAALACIAAVGTTGATEVHRWVDENGVVHYGTSIPPEVQADIWAQIERLPDEEGRTEARPRMINHAESPLAWLARRTDASGRPLISPREPPSTVSFSRSGTEISAVRSRPL